MFEEKLLAELFVEIDWFLLFLLSFVWTIFITSVIMIEIEDKYIKNFFMILCISISISILIAYSFKPYKKIHYETVLNSTVLQQEKEKNPEKYYDFILILKNYLEKDEEETISYRKFINMIEKVKNKERPRQLKKIEEIIKERDKKD